MSRGIGARQRHLLDAIGRLGARYARDWFPVWAVVDEAWTKELQQKRDALLEARAAEDRRWREEDARQREDVRRRAEAGDEAAKRQLDLQGQMDMLAIAIRQSVPRRSRLRRSGIYGGGAPLMRPNREAERILNPSRTLASLAERGLVERRGGFVRLTEAGMATQSADSAALHRVRL